MASSLFLPIRRHRTVYFIGVEASDDLCELPARVAAAAKLPSADAVRVWLLAAAGGADVLLEPGRSVAAAGLTAESRLGAQFACAEGWEELRVEAPPAVEE